jgi:N-acylneuraminate cytidylyltransferase
MINGKTVLAIVPARKGSKRLKLKNFRIFRGKPLFYWPLYLSEKSKYIDNIVFTTDSESMYFKAKNNFKIIDYIRPRNLAKSDSLASDVILDVLKKISLKFDYFIYLQPTSPLRTIRDIDNSLKMIVAKGGNTLVSVTENSKKPNGMIYISKTDFFEKKKSFYNKKIIFFKTALRRSADIDYIKDFDIAKINY